jgi:hypothetical protein
VSQELLHFLSGVGTCSVYLKLSNIYRQGGSCCESSLLIAVVAVVVVFAVNAAAVVVMSFGGKL